ncbi:MAG: DUF1003 domain-containing protein [Arenimonas sp.]|jgi:uncharacterized membrane protein
MATLDLSALSTRWLGKPADQVSESERGVLTRVHHRLPVSRNLALDDHRPVTFGERVADKVASFGGSWPFIGLFGAFLACWVLLNTVWLISRPLDPYPFIFLNLLLSMLAAIQAPIIMMSQNRHSQRDRVMAQHDYEVNLKAEIEILALHDKLEQMRVEYTQALIKGQQEQLAALNRLLQQRGE